MGLLATLAEDFVALLFPDFCLSCGGALARGEKQICTPCVAALHYTDYHLHPHNELSRRFWGKIDIDYSLAFLTFNRSGRVQRILHELKYRGAKQLGELMGNWYGARLKEAGLHAQFDLIVPVPLHKAKQKQRGYNQAEVFAHGLSENLGVELDSAALKRNVFTLSQTRKDRLSRWNNVNTVFSVQEPEHVQGKHVLLVDDVITTGATLEACANALYKAGAAKVSVAALAAA